ncbi:acyl-CoA dehydrogenase [Leifsonia sp. YIM 134122]|uniref:Acyl-CoA dehydrogenase n=1 Tax=Leifsonia stereocauli TaxID=3134136 RepID=A0ABU9W4A4_9MICO
MLPQTLSIADPAPSAVDTAGRTAPTPQSPRPVSLGALDWQENSSVLESALASMPEHSAGVSASLAWCAGIGAGTPRPGFGDTALVWELLASVAAVDLSLARMLEPHLDALAILDQAGFGDVAASLGALGASADSTWGVFAAEGSGQKVTAQQSAAGWRLSGAKPWCSLAGTLSHALVTAHTEGGRRLFAVDLRDRGVMASAGPWVSRGLSDIVSAPVTFTAVPAIPIGDDGWYLQRPGFAWGGVGVAACWWGGTVGLARTLYAASEAREPDQIGLVHLGAVDIAVESARLALAATAMIVDGAALPADRPSVTAKRVRSIVVAAAETTLEHVNHGMGPLPLVADDAHARRVADLQIYLRQHHAERDEAALGRTLLEAGGAPW